MEEDDEGAVGKYINNPISDLDMVELMLQQMKIIDPKKLVAKRVVSESTWVNNFARRLKSPDFVMQSWYLLKHHVRIVKSQWKYESSMRLAFMFHE